jgi:RND family efflux transporter MFP subunit
MKHFISVFLFFALCTAVAGAAAQDTFPVIFEATRKAVLSAEIPGVILSLRFDVGDRVKKGELIANVDIGDLDLRQRRSELSLRHLNVKVTNMERLTERGLATSDELAQAQTEKDVAFTDIQIYKRQIGKSRVAAPFDCIVVRRHIQAHEWATAGQPVVEVVDPAKLRAVGNIPSRLAVKLTKGTVHTFYVTDLDISISGTVEAVVPEVDELSNTAQVIWKIEKAEQDVLSGMKGEVRIDATAANSAPAGQPPAVGSQQPGNAGQQPAGISQ